MLWRDYDLYYSFFELKNLNWDSVYEVYQPAISSNTSKSVLFGIFKEIILSLKDGHANLMAGNYGYVQYDFASRYPKNMLSSIRQYVKLQARSQSISYGIISDDVGYIRISSFGGSENDFNVVDNILQEFKEKDLKGSVIDIRGNGGGSDMYSRLIANRFTNQKRVYSYYRYRNGPEHSDFGPWNSKTIEPEGAYYDRPVMVLTNRQVFSTAEDFVLAMRATPNATIVGDTTGGGSGNPLVRVLPNGWVYRIPRWIQVMPDMRTYEGIGIPPDLPTWISKTDSLAQKDTILEKALSELRK